MNKSQFIITLIILFLGIICFLDSIFILIYYIWTSLAIKILYYIFFSFLFLCYIYSVFLEILFNKSCLRNIRDRVYKKKSIIIFGVIFLFLSFSQFIVLSTNNENYKKYLKNCPYTISDLDLNLHLEKRFDLYNINNNSRYSYQYICSYNSSKDFKYQEDQINDRKPKLLEKEIKPGNVICLKVESLIKNNSIINLFNNEYTNSDKYYCSRTNKPEDFTYAHHKDCNNKTKKIIIIILYTINYLQVLIVEFYVGYVLLIRSCTYNFNLNLNDGNDLYFSNVNDETKETEISNRINSFRKEKTINIIIENKKIIPIKNDIKQSYTVNRIKKDDKLDSINIALNPKFFK